MRTTLFVAILLISGPSVQAAERTVENLDRGVVARPVDGGKVYVGWRLLESDPTDIAFNVYRQTGDADPVRLNERPIRKTTDYVDDSAEKGTEHAWFVREVGGGKEILAEISGSVTLDGQPAKAAKVTFLPKEGQAGPSASGVTDKTGRFEMQLNPGSYRVTIGLDQNGAARVQQVTGDRATPGEDVASYISIPLDGDHTFQKVGIADLDGDGRYDFVVKQPNQNIDPYIKYWKPSPDTYKLEAYRHDGKFLWRHDLGWSIERGIWYSPYIVCDLDGDGRAEVAVKTGQGDPREPDGRVRTGTEYLTILDGLTGKPVTQIDWPSREGFEGERGYNYASRNQLCVAYLDGKTPHLIVQRGTYNLVKLLAYRLRGGELEKVWRWGNTDLPKTYSGQGAHWMHTADVDADGRDEILLGSCVIDDNGKPLWTTGLGHPDHFYLGDLDPDRPGLEIYYGIERRQKERNGMCMVDAATGEILWGHEGPTRHVHGQGMCSDIDARYPGAECYSADTDSQKKYAWSKLRTCKGKVISEENLGGFSPRLVWWDADPQREMFVRGKIFSYGEEDTTLQRVEGSLAAVADILGDWREELIMSVPGELRIYTTTIPATDRRACLMQDPIYRSDVLSAAMGYFQVPMVSYDMATGKK